MTCVHFHKKEKNKNKTKTKSTTETKITTSRQASIFNTLRQRIGAPRLGGVLDEQYLAMLERGGSTNGEIPDVAGYSYSDHPHGTIGTLPSRHQHLSSGQWKKDQVSTNQYNQFKSLEDTTTNPIKKIEDLTHEDVFGDNDTNPFYERTTVHLDNKRPSSNGQKRSKSI